MKTQNHETSSSPLVAVFLHDHPNLLRLLRITRFRAKQLKAEWYALYVETPNTHGDSEKHERMLSILTLVAEMGGDPKHVEAPTVEEGIKRILEIEKDRLVLCLISVSEVTGWHGRWWKLFSSPMSHVQRLLSTYAKVEPVAVSDDLYPHHSAFPLSTTIRSYGHGLICALIALAIALFLVLLAPEDTILANHTTLALLVLGASAFTAGRFGFYPGLLAAALGYSATLLIPDTQQSAMDLTPYVNSLTVVLTVALSALITRNDYARQLDQRETSTQILFSLYRIAATASTLTQALQKLHSKLHRILKLNVAVFLPEAMNPKQIVLAYPPEVKLGREEQQALEVCWREMKTTGAASPYNPGTNWRFEPMLAQSGEIGVLAFRPEHHKLDPWHGRLLAAVADQSALILERIQMERSMESTRLSDEKDKLRRMLLSSVSHDLKTPLAGIIGALSAITTLKGRLNAAKQAALMHTALEEAHRLDSFISNIIQMTRLESKKFKVKLEWQKLDPSLKEIEIRMHSALRNHVFRIHPLPRDVEILMDVAMLEQVIVALLDNAIKYTPHGTTIEMSAYAGAKGYFIEIRDHGAGLPPDKFDTAFDKYARLQHKDSKIAGTGLGLSICKAMMEAQEGWITAGNHAQGGAVFTLCLPHWKTTLSLARYEAIAQLG